MEILKELAQDNLFCECFGAFIGALVLGAALRLRIVEWKAAAVAFGAIVAFMIGRAVILHAHLSVSTLLKQVMPMLAVLAWIWSAAYFRHHLRQSVEKAERALVEQMSRLRRELAEAVGKYGELQRINEKLKEQVALSSALWNRQEDIIKESLVTHLAFMKSMKGAMVGNIHDVETESPADLESPLTIKIVKTRDVTEESYDAMVAETGRVLITVAFSPERGIVQIAGVSAEWSCAATVDAAHYEKVSPTAGPTLPIKVDTTEIHEFSFDPLRKYGYIRLLVMAGGIRIKSPWHRIGPSPWQIHRLASGEDHET